MKNEIENLEKLMNEKNVEFRNFKLINSEEQKNQEGKSELILEGVACVFNNETILYKDATYELKEKIHPKAFENADMSDVIFNFNHCGRVYARTRNNSLKLTLKEDGLYVRIKLMGDDEGHIQLYRDIQNGLLDKMSFAFTVKKSEYEYDESKVGFISERRIITEIEKIYDVSVVDISAYDTTSISARRAFETVREERAAVSRSRAKNKLLLKLKLEGVN